MSVCLQDNYFLSRVYEPTTRASVYWCFRNLILKVPEKTSKSEVTIYHSPVRDQFWDQVLTNFLCQVDKNVTDRDYRVSGGGGGGGEKKGGGGGGGGGLRTGGGTTGGGG